MPLPPWGFFAALQFLTRIPVRLRSAPDLARSVSWFPVIGVCVGAVVGGVAAGLSHLLPPAVAAAIAVMFGVALTGAFHEDGLADTCDGLGGWTPERRREILKDSRHGSYGVAAMCGTVVLRVLTLASLGPAAAFAGSVAAHTLGRGGAVAVMGLASPVPTDGLGADYARTITTRRATIAVFTAVAFGAVAVGWWVLPMIVGVGTGAWVVSVIARRAFGGVSGDILGAVEQVGECVVLVVVSGLAMRHSVWWS